MRSGKLILGFILMVLLMVGCSEDRLTAPEENVANSEFGINAMDPEIIAAQMINSMGWELDPDVELPAKVQNLELDSSKNLLSFTREEIAPNIAHYTFEVRVGNGLYDVVRLHRVVKEGRPFKPVRTRKNLFMLPGDGAGFETAFLLSTLSDALPNNHSMPIFLAKKNVDVWGLDMAWTLVPPEVEDLSFMADWGLQKDIDDLRLTAGIARFIRLFTCHDLGKMNLLGWSRGGMIGYACLSEESQLPMYKRQFDGFIPVDIWAKTETYLENECAYAADLEGMMNEGFYADDTGAFLGWMVDLAQSAPDDVSEVFGPPFTNYTGMLAVGSMTYILGPTPIHYSIMAGTFDSDGQPTGFQYAPDEVWIDFVSNWSPYEPLLMEMETEWAVCGDPAHPVPFFDHLGDITVPVMYLGGQGGFGSEGLYSLEFLGSSDISSLVVSFNDDPFLDFGHADLFFADNARNVVWRPVLQWIRQH